MADKPVTREEKYLAYLTGDYTGELPKPITRKEKYLYELCLKGMGGEVSPEEIKSAVNEYLEKNPVKPGATTEQAQQIEQNKNDIGSLNESISIKITKFYASSQGETHLADSDNGKIMDMMLYGKSEQKQYSGKNLLKPTLKTTTLNGVTCTVNDDETYTLNGTATSKTEFKVIHDIALDTTKTYKLCGRPNGGSGYSIFCGINASPWTIYGSDSGIGVAFTPSSPSGNRVMITITSGTSLNNVVLKPMIVDASLYPDATYDDFEPYVGGQPSPSPDYPQKIKSVVNPTVKVCGKNLYPDGDLIELTKSYTTDFIPVVFNRNTIYLAFECNTNTVDGKYYINMIYYDKNKQKLGSNGSASQIGEKITKIEDSSSFNGIGAGNGGTNVDLNKVSYVKIVFNIYDNTATKITYKNIVVSSTPTAYEPYHEQTVTLPYTLNAVPVNSGGNVTIDGQQYVSDYFDVERGKLVRMVGEYAQNNQKWRIEKINANYAVFSSITAMSNMRQNDNIINYCSNYFKCISTNNRYSANTLFINSGYILIATMPFGTPFDDFLTLIEGKLKVFYELETPEEIDLTEEEIAALKELATYYPTTNISVNSKQLDGYTVFNYPISMQNGWNYVKQQIGDTRDYIYDMDARTQDTDLQAAEAYVNSEYAVALTELEV